MVGKKIRAYREFRGLNQIQLAQLSGINVGTIRKYELGLRNPKPDQLEKIAAALGLNISVFLDFNIDTVGDVLSLLFAIDDAVELSLSPVVVDGKETDTVAFTFKDSTLQNFVKKWCEFKNVYAKDKDKILTSEADDAKKSAALEELDQIQELWKLRAMGTSIGCHNVIRKGTDEHTVKINNYL